MHKLQMNYLKDLIIKYHEIQKPIWALNWQSEISHDYLNRVGLKLYIYLDSKIYFQYFFAANFKKNF